MTLLRTTVTSSLALAVAAGLLATSAQAADLGGNCCTDLEERIAELEATTVRKGNRRVSLQLYGQVSQAVMFWDDGAERNVYVLENDNTKNRLGVRGSAKIAADWSAGYQIELQIRSGRSSSANQFPLATTQGASITAFNTQSVSLRFAYWTLQSERYGKIDVGRMTDVTIGTSTVSLVDADGFAGPVGAGYAGQGFRMRRAGTTGNGGLSSLNWFTGAFAANGATVVSYDYGPAWNGVKYTSPFFLGQSKRSGFQFSAGWGHDDAWGVALRYAEQFQDIRLAAAIGYGGYTDNDRGACTNLAGATNAVSQTDCNSLQISGSILHVPTGLYVSAGWAEWTDHNRNKPAALAGFNVDKTDDFWYIQAGWQAKLNPLGNTIFWGQYMNANIGMGMDSGTPGAPTGPVARTLAAGDVINSLGTAALLSNAESTIWGGGITQNVDAAAMALYVGYYNFSTDITLQATNNAANKAKSNPIDDFSVFFTGATIKF